MATLPPRASVHDGGLDLALDDKGDIFPDAREVRGMQASIQQLRVALGTARSEARRSGQGSRCREFYESNLDLDDLGRAIALEISRFAFVEVGGDVLLPFIERVERVAISSRRLESGQIDAHMALRLAGHGDWSGRVRIYVGRSDECRVDGTSLPGLFEVVQGLAGASDPRIVGARVETLATSMNVARMAYVGVEVTSGPRSVDLVPKLYGDGGLVHALEQWEGRRESGFNLRPFGGLKLEGSSVVLTATHASARIDADGSMTLVVPARKDGLCWTMSRFDNGAIRIHPLVLVEIVEDFFRVFSIVRRASGTRAWTTTVHGRGHLRGRLEHGRGRVGSECQTPANRATADSHDFAIGSLAAEDSEVNAALALQRIYAMWGLGLSDVPFVSDGRVDVSELRAAADRRS